MTQYINKSVLEAEIERRIKKYATIDTGNSGKLDALYGAKCKALMEILYFLDTLEVKDPYEQYVQHSSIKDGIKAHAETYSFNIESELFNQLTKEQQALWRKEIEQACISGGEAGVELARDIRYKENVEVKKVDLEHEVESYWKQCNMTWCRDAYSMTHIRTMLSDIAKHFFELGLQVNNPITAVDRGMTEEIIINLKRVEQDYNIDLTREMEWLRNKARKEEPELTVDDIMKLDALLISMWQSKSPNKYEEVLKQFKAQKGEQQ